MVYSILSDKISGGTGWPCGRSDATRLIDKLMNYNDQDDLPNLVTEGISKGVFSFKEHGLHLADPRVDAKNFIASTSKEIVKKTCVLIRHRI